MSSFLQRYLHGEHERVWDELITLGDQVREEPYHSDALAVTRETMRRARHNIEQLIPRLVAIGYQFGYGWIQPAQLSEFGWQQRKWYRDRLSWAREQPTILSLPTDVVHELANRQQRLARLRELGATPLVLNNEEQRIAELQAQPKVADTLDTFERTIGVLPLSVRAWYEMVSHVNFVGMHPGWFHFFEPLDPSWSEDDLRNGGSPFHVLAPLYVHSLEMIRLAGKKDMRPIRHLPFIPNEHAEYGSEGQGTYDYELAIPCLTADAALLLYPEETTFVAYLRESFRWGGFRGWARQEQRPEQDIAFLTHDLLPI